MSSTTYSYIRDDHELDDLERGHSVIIAARWMLVAAGLGFVLYRPHSISELTIGVLSVLAIAVINFWLHTRPLTNQALEPSLAYIASAADLAVISGLVLMQGVGTSKSYSFYYPAILAYSLVFPRALSLMLTGSVLSFLYFVGTHGGQDLRVLVAQLLTLFATAVVGWRYRDVEEQRRQRRRQASGGRGVFGSESARLDAQEDIFYGQIVCILARWCVIAGAIFLALYQATDIVTMERSLIPLLVLVAANFFLQARYMMGLPANALLLQISSLVDMGVITALVIGGSPDLFVFYFPVVIAYALVFVRRVTLMFTAAVGLGYAAVSVLTGPGLHFDGDEETLAIRLVTLLGSALLATLYWRIQRARAAEGA